ncbi:hypothetical protein ABIB25_001956 [Nakamurella sp. UYEF19]|uniref:hypothetical protein n=1 Tax=Nakamurella sp. UYEF19 TaxID=1756392 RepID=UPI0033949E73
MRPPSTRPPYRSGPESRLPTVRSLPTTLLAAYEDDEYSPEYGTFLVRDSYDNFTGETNDDLPLLDEYGTDAQPCGTIGRGGSGWLDGPACGSYEPVRLESHDSAPARDDARWDTVVETPFRSVTGVVGLSQVTSGFAESAQLVLARPGDLRARICCRLNTDEDEHVWLVQFWPAPVVPPSWLKRRESPVAAVTGTPWTEVVPGFDVLLHGIEMAASPEVSLDELDLAVPLLVAAGVLESAGPDRIRLANDPPRPQDVVELDPDLAMSLARYEEVTRYSSFASDIAFLVLWSGPASFAVEQLAEQLLATTDDVRETIEQVQLVHSAVSSNSTRSPAPPSAAIGPVVICCVRTEHDGRITRKQRPC